MQSILEHCGIKFRPLPIVLIGLGVGLVLMVSTGVCGTPRLDSNSRAHPIYTSVAQPNRAFVYETKGFRFES